MYMGCLLRMLMYEFSGKKILFHFQASGGDILVRPSTRELLHPSSGNQLDRQQYDFA
jgi:hypothetical protein